MPLVLVLSRSDELMSRVFGGLNRTGKVVFVNISQPDYGGLATRVNDLLAANRVTAPEYLTAKGKSERRGLTPTTPRDNPVM
jgi:fructoselysine-6-P-deglycase FrlB-like protein